MQEWGGDGDNFNGVGRDGTNILKVAGMGTKRMWTVGMWGRIFVPVQLSIDKKQASNQNLRS